MKDIIASAMKQIKQEKIKPDPRWKCVLKKYVMWIFLGAIVASGALSFAIMVDILVQLDWDLYRFTHRNAVSYAVSIIPYICIVILGALTTLAFFDLRKTEMGYRYNFGKLILGIGAGVIVCGMLCVFLGIGAVAHDVIARNIPYYAQHMVTTKEVQWMQPENGFLAGTIENVKENELILHDLNNGVWYVDFDEDTVIRPSVSLMDGEKIKIVGDKTGMQSFDTKEIRPWTGKRQPQNMKGGSERMEGRNEDRQKKHQQGQR